MKLEESSDIYEGWDDVKVWILETGFYPALVN
jgi:hypothetical protein